jgi:chemotaxis protein histidine kinase CheA
MSTDHTKPQIVTPPNLLRQKVSGSGPISEEMLSRADQALEQLSGQFTNLMAGEIAKLNDLHRQGVDDPGRRLQLAREIFQVAHDLRGQAGTFDYPLISRVGTSLCHFTDGMEECDERGLEVIRIHINAMQAVLASALQGDGGAVGQEIATGLEQAVEKVMS